MSDFVVLTLSGAGIEPYIEELARLRIEVFREYPYLYEGSSKYEEKYLRRYLASPRSCVVIAQTHAGEIIGASTGLPLADEEDFVKQPFLSATDEMTSSKWDISKIFYFGESVLHRDYRGRGLGHIFFDEREKHALKFGHYNVTTFCAVDRGSHHPLKPASYRPLDEFWKKRGYEKREELVGRFSWPDLGEKSDSEKEMIFWIKRW